MLYPISVQTFETLRERDYIYVDKTDLVYELAKEHVCFLSRPRRFGKSLLISTLEAYFLGKKDLFQGLKMESLKMIGKSIRYFELILQMEIIQGLSFLRKSWRSMLPAGKKYTEKVKSMRHLQADLSMYWKKLQNRLDTKR